MTFATLLAMDHLNLSPTFQANYKISNNLFCFKHILVSSCDMLLYNNLFYLFISFNDKGPQPLTCHNKITLYINECHW